MFLGTSGGQAIAAHDLVEQCPGAVSESVCQPNPTTKQQHIEIGAVTSGRGNGKMLGKIVMLRLHGTSITDRCTTQFNYCFSFSRLYENMKSKTLQLLHQYTESFMVSLIYEGWMSSNFMYTA